MSHDISNPNHDNEPVHPVGLTFTTGFLAPIAARVKDRAKNSLDRAGEEMVGVAYSALSLAARGATYAAAIIVAGSFGERSWSPSEEVQSQADVAAAQQDLPQGE